MVTPTLPKGKKGWRPKTVVAVSTTNIKKSPKLEQKNNKKERGGEERGRGRGGDTNLIFLSRVPFGNVTYFRIVQWTDSPSLS